LEFLEISFDFFEMPSPKFIILVSLVWVILVLGDVDVNEELGEEVVVFESL